MYMCEVVDIMYMISGGMDSVYNHAYVEVMNSS